jgi:hypothetical protein
MITKVLCLLIFVLFNSPLMAGSVSKKDEDDFWKKCPGPACPAQSPGIGAGITNHQHGNDGFAREDNKANSVIIDNAYKGNNEVNPNYQEQMVPRYGVERIFRY